VNLTMQERETIILFNEAQDTASVDTCNPALNRKLDKLIALQENKGAALVREDEHGKVYVIPKSWVKVNAGPVLTEEKRAEMAAAAKARFGHTAETTTGGETAPSAHAGKQEAQKA
jgi:hypothetical protein